MTESTQPDLIIFPGAHKTGTTLLQSALKANRKLLDYHNMCLIDRGAFYRSDFSAYLKKESHKQRNSVSLAAASRSLSRLCKGNLNRTLIISIENLFGEFGHEPIMYHATKPVLSTFKKLLPRHKIRVAFYVRKQDTFFESAYIQRVHKLSAGSFEQFFEKYGTKDMRWTPILNDIANCVDRENLSVRAFENIKIGANVYVRDMFNFISPILAKNIKSISNKNNTTNVSLSQKGLDIALSLFPEFSKKERGQLIAFLKNNFGNDKYPKAQLLSAEQRSSVLLRFKADNTLLADRYLVGQPGCSEYTT